MAIDAFVSERHFIDHLAPIWRALPDHGAFQVTERLVPGLTEHVRRLGIEYVEVAGHDVSPTVDHRSQTRGTCLVASYGDIKHARRLGYREFVFAEHGIGQSYAGRPGLPAKHGSYAGGQDRDDVSLFLVPNEHSANRWREGYPNAQVEVIGCPRLDDLPRREPGPLTIALSFHWESFGSPLLAPEVHGTFGHYRSALAGLAKAYKILGHAHPRNLDWLTRQYRQFGIEVVPDFGDVCRRADLYICDNSSTLYEFAATSRPVVVLNGPHYRREVSHGLRFWDAADVGIQVDEPAQLLGAVAEALRDPPEAQAAREAALSLVYAHRNGAAVRAASAMAREAVAA